MQGTGDHFLAAAGFAQQQYRQFVHQPLACHAQSAGVARVIAGKGFKFGTGRRARRACTDRHRMAAQRRLQGLVEQLALGRLQAAHAALVKPRNKLLAAQAEEVFATPTDEGFTVGAEQLAGLPADGQHLAVQPQRQQALPG